MYTNGDIEVQSGGEEGAVQNTQGDGSDTDSSKHDNLDNVDRGSAMNQRHVRSDSFKKPASFKAVSVTKNFLAKAAAGTTPAGKGIGDKCTQKCLYLREYYMLTKLSFDYVSWNIWNFESVSTTT